LRKKNRQFFDILPDYFLPESILADSGFAEFDILLNSFLPDSILPDSRFAHFLFLPDSVLAESAPPPKKTGLARHSEATR
jgi:hypothetical protein